MKRKEGGGRGEYKGIWDSDRGRDIFIIGQVQAGGGMFIKIMPFKDFEKVIIIIERKGFFFFCFFLARFL